MSLELGLFLAGIVATLAGILYTVHASEIKSIRVRLHAVENGLIRLSGEISLLNHTLKRLYRESDEDEPR